MSDNILPMIEADSVSFDPPRDKQALAGVIADAEIAGLGHEPLTDEDHRPDPSQAEARENLDPIVVEQLDEDRPGDAIVQDGQRAMAEEEINRAVNTAIDHRGRVPGTFERNQQKFIEEVGDYSDSIYPVARNRSPLCPQHRTFRGPRWTSAYDPTRTFGVSIRKPA